MYTFIIRHSILNIYFTLITYSINEGNYQVQVTREEKST
jgi:hypothetical protein